MHCCQTKRKAMSCPAFHKAAKWVAQLAIQPHIPITLSLKNMTVQAEPYQYCPDMLSYKRRETIEVNIGDVPMGSMHPIRVQSMTTVDTMDTEGSIAQSVRMIESGCEYIRITAPSLKEAENLKHIKAGLRKLGYGSTPLVADIHFTPNAAELAARLVEKVRINPGNYADKKRFETIEYTDAAYQAELDRIRERFSPLVKICKEHGTAMRIGTNHGSLSDRIMSRYGDTPLGMAESALEFIRVCEDLNYYNIVVSMKASNTQVMVQAYRLLVQNLAVEGLKPYPLHLGVTEAGDGVDGRIKSAVGIGALLEDGLGDTVRVSLTEDPELEAPVARALIDRYTLRASLQQPIRPLTGPPKNPFRYEKRQSIEIHNMGGGNVPRVMADFSDIKDLQMADFKAFGYTYLPLTDKWGSNDTAADFVYLGSQPVPFMMPNGLKAVQDYGTWKSENAQAYPLFSPEEYMRHGQSLPQGLVRFVSCQLNDWLTALSTQVTQDRDAVLLIHTQNEHAMPELRRFFFLLAETGCQNPVAVWRKYTFSTSDKLQLYAATDVGSLLVDGLGDGVMLSVKGSPDDKTAQLALAKQLNQYAFGILQAARTRMTKTEYISCPSCGRTLFDLQETTAMIRKQTDHLKGVKIGIMGCIVNGPGEMADADYGYVGSGKGRITLYRGQDVVVKSVPSDKAVQQLIGLIKEDGKWIEPLIEPAEAENQAGLVGF